MRTGVFNNIKYVTRIIDRNPEDQKREQNTSADRPPYINMQVHDIMYDPRRRPS